MHSHKQSQECFQGYEDEFDEHNQIRTILKGPVTGIVINDAILTMHHYLVLLIFPHVIKI